MSDYVTVLEQGREVAIGVPRWAWETPEEERRCFNCGRTADRIRGWVMNQTDPDDEGHWWLCNDCLDRKPHLEWADDGTPTVLHFHGC